MDNLNLKWVSETIGEEYKQWSKDNKIISTDKNVRGLNVDNKYNKLIKDKEQLEIIK